MDEWSIMYPAHWEQLRLPTQFTHEEAANLFWCGETRALIWLEDPLSSSLTKLLAEDRSPTCGLVNYLIVATHQTSLEQASHEGETEGEKESVREQQTPSTT